MIADTKERFRTSDLGAPWPTSGIYLRTWGIEFLQRVPLFNKLAASVTFLLSYDQMAPGLQMPTLMVLVAALLAQSACAFAFVSPSFHT